MKTSSGATAWLLKTVAGWKPSRPNGLMFTSQVTVTVTAAPGWTGWPAAGNPATWACTLPAAHQLVAPRSAWAACTRGLAGLRRGLGQGRGPGRVPGRAVQVPLCLHHPARRADQQEQQDQAGRDDDQLDAHGAALPAHHPQPVWPGGRKHSTGPPAVAEMVRSSPKKPNTE